MWLSPPLYISNTSLHFHLFTNQIFPYASVPYKSFIYFPGHDRVSVGPKERAVPNTSWHLFLKQGKEVTGGLWHFSSSFFTIPCYYNLRDGPIIRVFRAAGPLPAPTRSIGLLWRYLYWMKPLPGHWPLAIGQSSPALTGIWKKPSGTQCFLIELLQKIFAVGSYTVPLG